MKNNKKIVSKQSVTRSKAAPKKQVAKKSAAKPKSIAKKPAIKPDQKKIVPQHTAGKPKKQTISTKPALKSTPKKPTIKKPVIKPVSKKPMAKPVLKKPIAKPVQKKATPSKPIAKKQTLGVVKPVQEPSKLHVYQWTSDRADHSYDFVVAAQTPEEALSYADIPVEKAWYLGECIEKKLRTMALGKPGTVFARDLSFYLNRYEEFIVKAATCDSRASSASRSSKTRK